MKLWKSPVLYIGVILLAVVIGALLAPFVIDWNPYRADLEAYGRKLSGREVTIAGPISVRFFPWPSLTAHDVHLANPPGLDEPEFAKAARITARMQLAGLFSGTIQVESIEIDQPVIAFERTTTGEGNWLFHPAIDLDDNRLLGHVRLDQITLTEAAVRLIDRRRGTGEISLAIPAATLASPGITGPWRLTAANVEHSGQRFAVSISTAIWKADEPFRFSAHVSGADNSGPTYNFDGAIQDDRVSGDVQIDTAAATEGKGDAEGQVRPLVVRSKMVATFDAIAFDEIEIAPVDPTQGGTLVSGSAKLALGKQISAAVDLSAPTLDLTEWVGANANQLLREGGSLGLADGLLKLLPGAVDLSGALKVTALTVAGETLENTVLRMEASSEFIRVRELSASLPGHSRMLFDGVFFPGAAGAELAGNLALESNNLRQLASWSWPEGKDQIAKLWTGSRGRLKLQTEINLTENRFRLTKLQYEIDGVPGAGELAISAGGGGAIDLRIDARKLDVDNFIPGGLAAVPTGGKTGLAGLFGFLMPHEAARDLAINVKAGELVLNGVTAADVTIDIASGANGLDLRMLKIGSVGGAQLMATGLILDAGGGPDGSIGIDVTAEDPRGLLRLLGVLPADSNPAWTEALGVTALKGGITVKTHDKDAVSGFEVAGRSGDYVIKAAGQVMAENDLNHLRIDGSADLQASSSASMARLAGLMAVGTDQSTARLTLRGSGSLADGFRTTLQLQAYGGRLDFTGTLGGPTGVDGKLGLRTTDAGPLFAAMGLPSVTLPTGVVVLDTRITSEGENLVLPDLAGRFGDAPIGGRLALAPRGHISGDLDLGPLDLDAVLAAVFLAWNGLAPEQEAPFAENLPGGLSGEVWINASSLKIVDTFTAMNVPIGITASPGEILLSIRAKDAAGRDAAVEIGSRGNDGNRALAGRVKLPLDLARQLLLAGGAPVAEGTGSIELGFNSRGRSPGGALAALQGSGSYDIKGLRLLNLSPQDFNKVLAEVRDAAGLNAAFEALRGGEGLVGGDIRGSITILNGVAAFLPFTISTPDADAVVRTSAELASGFIDTAVSLSLKFREGLPAMEVSYVGPPTALARNEDKAELVSTLGYGIMQQGVAELERLQKEQQRLAVEEEKLRLADEEKLQAYYAQRDEVLLRRRELKVHAEMRVLAAEKQRLEIESERAANTEINRTELKQRQRELRVHRRLARLAQKDLVAEPAPTPRVKPPAVKPENKAPAQVPILPPSQQ